MEIQIVDKNATTVNVSDRAFGCEYNEALVHQLIVAYMAGGRQGTKAQKTRSAVNGGGRKPWRQKGTGNARAGTIRSPLWRGGGVTFAAKPRDYSHKVNKKMYRRAMAIIFSELLRQERIKVVDALELSAPKTKELIVKLKELNVQRVLIITKTTDPNLVLASRNLPNVEVCDVTHIDPVSLIAFDNILLTSSALKRVEERLL